MISTWVGNPYGPWSPARTPCDPEASAPSTASAARTGARDGSSSSGPRGGSALSDWRAFTYIYIIYIIYIYIYIYSSPIAWIPIHRIHILIDPIPIILNNPQKKTCLVGGVFLNHTVFSWSLILGVGCVQYLRTRYPPPKKRRYMFLCLHFVSEFPISSRLTTGGCLPFISFIFFYGMEAHIKPIVYPIIVQ